MNGNITVHCGKTKEGKYNATVTEDEAQSDGSFTVSNGDSKKIRELCAKVQKS